VRSCWHQRWRDLLSPTCLLAYSMRTTCAALWLAMTSARWRRQYRKSGNRSGSGRPPAPRWRLNAGRQAGEREN